MARSPIEDLTLLIELIYDRSTPEYKDELILQGLWSEIADVMKCKAEICKKSWVNLRKNFCLERKARSRFSPNFDCNGKRMKQFEHYDNMLWFSKHMPVRNRMRNRAIGKSNEEKDATEIEADSSTRGGNFLQNDDILADMEDKPLPYLAEKYFVDTDGEMINFNQNDTSTNLIKISPITSSPCARNTRPTGAMIDANIRSEKTTFTEEELFGQMITQKLTKLSPVQKSIAMIRVQELMLEVEHGVTNSRGENCI